MTGETYIIGIVGGSGSGKTSLVRSLKDIVAEDVSFISLDDYYHPREEQLTDKNGINNFDRPESIDSKALVTDILALKSGKSVSRPQYTFNNKLATSTTIITNPARVIVVEGLFIFHYIEIMNLLDLKVYIDAKEELRIIRRIKRDQAERNYPIDDVMYLSLIHI